MNTQTAVGATLLVIAILIIAAAFLFLPEQKRFLVLVNSVVLFGLSAVFLSRGKAKPKG
jgi:hypothetical protein